MRVAALIPIIASSLVASGATAQEEDRSRAATPIAVADWGPKVQQDYPSLALRNGEQGTVTMRITIDVTGRVSACEVTTSSGSTSLDAAGCRAMMIHARFNPALDKNGNPIASTSTQSIRYLLPEGAKPMHFAPPSPIDESEWRNKVFNEAFVTDIEASESGSALFLLTIDEQGAPVGCGMLWPSGDADLDRRTCGRLLAQARFLPARLKDGDTIPGSYSVAYPSLEAVKASSQN